MFNFYDISLGSHLIPTIAALIPAAVLMIFIYQQDKIEKEPVKLLLKIFLFGVLSIIPALILEIAGQAVLGLFLSTNSVIYIVIENFIVVALSEEFSKWLAARLSCWKSPEFNYKFDAIVYCVTSALGFAALENILYVTQWGLSVAVSRALLSVPSHAIDGALMGYFFGVAKEAEMRGNLKKRKIYTILAIFIPAVLHGIYDCSLSFNSVYFLIVFFAFVVVVDVWAFRFIRKQSKEDAAL